MKTKTQDTAYMQQALELARRGRGKTRPNPPVGALLVKRGRIIGRGWHRRAGGPHAEIYALRQAGTAARGATLYVTLEPCSSHGRTGACTAAIIAAGIKRVVVAVNDPNPSHKGRGLRVLRKHGVEVSSGITRREAAALIEPFSTTVKLRRPFVTLKMASTLDGRIADKDGASRWITGPAARRLVRQWRRGADAIMVGAGTVAADDPALLALISKSAPGNAGTYRLVIDLDGILHKGYRVFSDEHRMMTCLITKDGTRTAGLQGIERAGINVWRIPEEPRGSHFLKNALETVYEKLGLLHVLCEGGGQLAAGLIAAGLVDELKLFIAGRVLGAEGVPVVGKVRAWSMAEHPRFEWIKTEMAGKDVLLTGREYA